MGEGVYWDVDTGDIGTHWGNIQVVLELCRDNGKEHGNYCSILGCMEITKRVYKDKSLLSPRKSAEHVS